MIVKLHKNARTTPAIRAQLAASNESVAVLAKRFNLAPNTVRKWQARTDFNDRSHTAHNLQTTLSSAQEHIVIYLRKHLLLPLDDLLSVTREFLCPEVSRSGLNRCLRRHGVGNLRDMTRSQDNKPKYQRFKDYPIGFVHIDIKYLPQMADESKRKYLFVAIDRATRMVCVQLRESKTAKDAREFLKFVTERFPFEIKKVLTDNGKEFTNKVFGYNATNKTHEFDDLCLSLGIEHRLTRVRRPQTNGMVERFNGRIADILRTHHFQSGKELEHTLLRYVNLYNNHLPQANLNCRTPYQVMYEWYENKPRFFDKAVHNRPEGDTYALHRLLSDMKRIISSAPAKFIFVGNRLLHDEWAADQSRRQPLLTSIFDKEIYLPSLMLDHSTSSNTYGDQTYTHLSMRIREYIVRRKQLADDVYKRVTKDRSSSLLALSRHDPSETYYSADNFRDNEVDTLYDWLGEIPVIDCEIGTVIKEEDKFWNTAFINSFVHFLTYRSAGNPKRLHELVNQFARPASRFSNDNNLEKFPNCHHVLHFSNVDIFRVQLIGYIYMHIVERFETKLADRDDKVATALIYLLDFIMKFHPRAFSWETMERIDEMAHIHRTPGLRLILESLVNESSERLFHNLLNGMYAFRFRSELAKEIVYLSRISEEEGASFNFTLDEAQGLKASYIMALSKESDKDIDKTFALGNLYEYDEQYEDARKMYTQAISMLDEQLFHHVGKENSSSDIKTVYPIFPQLDTVATLKLILSQDGDGALNTIWFSKWISYRLRLLLHMGLTYEISNNLETAKSEYMQARLLARAVIGIVASYPNVSNSDDKDKIVYNSAVDLIKHINVLYQPILAEAWISEKMIGAVDTSGSLLESELIWLRKSLPFLNEPRATADEKMTDHLESGNIMKKEGGYSNYNFALIAAELHNKAGDLYFFKGQQRYHTERSLPNSANNGSIFRAHYHYAVALHEIRRSIFCRRVTSGSKLNAGLNLGGFKNYDDNKAFRKRDWPTFFGQSIYSTLTDLGDTILARTSLLALLRENYVGDSELKSSSEQEKSYNMLVRNIDSYRVDKMLDHFTDCVVTWMDKSDLDCTIFSTEPNEKSFIINENTKDFIFDDLIKDYFGEWDFTEKDISSPYPVIVSFGKPSSHLVRLLVSLHLNAAGAEIAIISGYVQNAAQEYLLLLEKLAGIIKFMRMIIHFDEDYFFSDNEVAKLDHRQKESLFKCVRSRNKKIVSYLAKFAAEIARKYDNICFTIWRRRPNSDSGNYLLGNRISIEAATALISIRLSVADSKYSDIASKNFNASCDKLLRKWLGKSSSSSYLKDAFQDGVNDYPSIDSLLFRKVLSYLLTRHRFPILNHLLMLKTLTDDVALCYHVHDKHPSSRMHSEFASEVLNTERWARELRIASERYDAPMHFSPYMYGETAALLVLSGVEGYYYEKGRKSMTLGESPLGRGAIEGLIQSRESYSMGRQYYENISSLYYLYDDFNDRRIHSTHAILMSGSDIAAHLERALVQKARV